MASELVIYKDFDGLQRAALALFESGYFSDVKSQAQAIVKVMAGSELGLPAFASMSGIHIIQGKPVLGSNVMATLVKNDPRYDYRIKQADDQACILTWYENGEVVGEAGFTIQEAQNAGLTGKDNWKKYKPDMLFARAISRGARRFAPGIFGGSPVYTPDEMGVDTDEDGYIDASSITVSKPEPQPDPAPEPGPEPTVDGKPRKPRRTNAEILVELGYESDDPETLKAALKKRAEEIGSYDASDKQRNFLGSLLSEYYTGDDTARYTASAWLFGSASTKDIDGAMVKAALSWLGPEQDSGGAYAISETARHELGGVLAAAQVADGQEALL